MDHIYHLSRHDLVYEKNHDGILCGGVVFPWNRHQLSVYTGPRCWGHTVSVPADSYVNWDRVSTRDPDYHERPLHCNLDDPGDIIEIIRVLSTEPLQLECTQYIAYEVGDVPPYRPLDAEHSYRVEGNDGRIHCHHGDSANGPV